MIDSPSARRVRWEKNKQSCFLVYEGENLAARLEKDVSPIVTEPVNDAGREGFSFVHSALPDRKRCRARLESLTYETEWFA
jgi:hypothetical protein